MSSNVDHVTEFLQSVLYGAPSEAEARNDIEQAVESVLPNKTRIVRVADLLGDEVFVGDMGGLSRITENGSGPSSSLPGFYVANTEHGCLYLDLDGEVTVLDD
jgi:hypothetical protein